MLRTPSPNVNKKHRTVLLATGTTYKAVSPALDTMLMNMGKILVETKKS